MLVLSLTTNWYLRLTPKKFAILKLPPICKYRSLRATCMSPARNPCTWPLHVTLTLNFCTWLLCSLAHSRSWVNWASLHGFAKSAISWECQRSVVSARDISWDFFHSRWAFIFGHLLILLLPIGWLFYSATWVNCLSTYT